MGGIFAGLRRKMAKGESRRYRVVAPEGNVDTHQTWRRPLSQEERRQIRDERPNSKCQRDHAPRPPSRPAPKVQPSHDDRNLGNLDMSDRNDERTLDRKSGHERPRFESGKELDNTMASVVQDLWQTLMNDQATHLKAIGGDLFSMDSRKQNVQKAQERLGQAEEARDAAREKMLEMKQELRELGTKLIQAGSGEGNRLWRTGELCFRKGILCTIEQVHYDEDPPYFEVQAVYSPRMIVGTEGSILLVPAPFQQGSLRQKLREVESTTQTFKNAEAQVAFERISLRDSHDSLVTAHELASIHQEEEPEILPAPADFSGAPPGMPDMSLVQKWTGPLRDIPEEETATWETTLGSEEYELYTTDDGDVYYLCCATGETTWALPPGARLISTPGEPQDTEEPQDNFMKTRMSEFGENYSDLSQQAAQQAEDREAWNRWYQEYTAWYQSNLPEEEARQFGHGPQSEPKPIPEPPEKTVPKIQPPSVSTFGDKATHALVVAIQKEMASMLERKAPVAERRRALRELHRQWHPDKNPDKADVAKSIFQFVEESKDWFLEECE